MLERLKQADANQDGQLTYEEITKMAPQFPKRGFQRLDVNNDGVLSPEDRPQ